MNKWEITTVGDFCPFQYGKGLKETERNMFGQFNVFGSNGIVGKHDKPFVGTRGVIIGRKGSVGAVHFSNKPFWPIDTTFYVAESPNREIRYIYYLLKSLGLEHMNSDSAVPGLNRNAAHARQISVPPLLEQRAIAEVLGALDDKIELNRRMNRTLESMARGVFRQWFVENEEAAGWKIGKLGDVAENIRRSANADEIEPETHYIGLEHMPRGSIALSEWGNASELASNKFIFKEGEFLFGKLRPYFHKVGISPVDGVCSTDILVIAPKSPEWYGFVLGHISSVELINHTNAASTGTKMPRTNWTDIANYEVAIPPVKKAKKYSEIFLPMAQRIRANIMESRTLASLRDSLLPKLMRGEVRVKGL